MRRFHPEVLTSSVRAPLTRAPARLGAALALLQALGAWYGLPASAQEPSRRILLLHAYNYTFPAAAAAADSARDRLRQRSPQRIELYVENLDLIRFSEPGLQQLMADFLRDRYAKRQPELVMLVGGEGLPFVLRHRDTFAPGVPVVFVGTSRVTLSAIRRPSDVTGHAGDQATTLANTLALAERLQPSARRLYIIAGSGPNDRRWQEIVRTTLEGRLQKFETTYLFERTYEDLLADVSRISSDSIVIMLTVIHDRSGKLLIPRDVMRAVLKVSKAPVYSPHAFMDAPGYVGGFVEPDESWGRVGADIALEILAGKPAATISPRAAEGEYQVDYRALQHFGLSERNLPQGTIVLHKQPSIWDQHRNLVLATLVLFLLQTAFVAMLLIQRRNRQLAERLFKESEERMAFTAASANVGLWQLDRQTAQLWTTEHCRALFGLKANVPLTRDRFLAAVHPEDRDAAIAALRELRQGKQVGIHDIRVVLPDGHTRWISVRARAHSDDGDNRVSGIFVDVTEQKLAESETAQKREEVAHLMRVSVLGELSGALAHEINQPLAALQSNAETALDLLAGNPPNFSELRGALEDMAHDTRRAGEVIERMRSLLKKGQKRSELIELNELVNSTIVLINNELISRRISLKLELDTTLPAASGDPVQLQQVLLNLVMNAMDAMTDTPVGQRLLTISTRTPQPTTIEVIVRDSGSGIGPGEEKRLFEPFYTTKSRGLGLGLTICSTIIETHGGTLTLANSDGGGAVVRLSLPVPEILASAAE
jgi:PAS domain S-box-containing protein